MPSFCLPGVDPISRQSLPFRLAMTIAYAYLPHSLAYQAPNFTIPTIADHGHVGGILRQHQFYDGQMRYGIIVTPEGLGVLYRHSRS
ncbi:hypothetical protein [Desulfosporosinus metallidurans]|uniref:hypothetical protein n=1 Tax=Desulfosporosinus metallidurans TaxID=1888891 RepID=UPI000A8EC459|nr:hypothetical protein [Desulfosporosinus metallidurans]